MDVDKLVKWIREQMKEAEQDRKYATLRALATMRKNTLQDVLFEIEQLKSE